MVTDLEPDGTEGRVTKTDDDDDDDDDDVQQLSTKSTSYFLLPNYSSSSSSNVFLEKKGHLFTKAFMVERRRLGCDDDDEIWKDWLDIGVKMGDGDLCVSVLMYFT